MAKASLCDIAARYDHCARCQLKPFSICSVLSDEEMAAVAPTMAHLPVKEGASILREGDPTSHFFVIVSGSFRLVRNLEDGRRQVVGFVFPGDVLGTTSLDASSLSAEALEPSVICRFSHAFLDQMSDKHPAVREKLLAHTQSDLRKAHDHIVLLGQQSAEERLASFLERLSTVFGGREFHLPMPRQDIADYLGLRLETLSRTIAKLKDRGTIETARGRSIRLSEEAA